LAQGGDCVACHGDMVDNMADGHYIPAYAPSLVTPHPSDGKGSPPNHRGNGAGACNYCHDSDNLTTPVIRSNAALHHETGLLAGYSRCNWCHLVDAGGDPVFDPAKGGLQMRGCEGCHGPDSLHNIQTDSPNANNVGTLVVGGEDAGYGHIGRDAGPGDSDCWGCHGFEISATSTPISGPTIPTINWSDQSVVRGGKSTTLLLSGEAFTNTTAGKSYQPDVRLTASDGKSVTLQPDLVLDQANLAVTIPARTAPGNYSLRVVKGDVASNPVVISVSPTVRVSRAIYQGQVTILGQGFGGYAKGSSTSVTGTVSRGSGRRATAQTVQAEVISWSNTKIVVDFGALPDQVTVNSVFGSASAPVSRR